MVKSEVVLEVGESPKVVEESDKVRVVGLEYLPILLALDKMELVVKQKQVVVDYVVFNSQLEVCLDCWLITQLVVSSC